jgi:benzoyl-CoA reductase/2-hydroxyglutaryl-CoA dehydratase subunit BcrC/BadD/HgdB
MDDRYNRSAQLKRLLKLTKEKGRPKKSPFYKFKASHKRANVIANFFRKAYRGDSKVVYRSVIMPTEIFFAFDFVPICLETACAMLASSNISPYLLSLAEQNHYSQDLCSFTRCALGATIGDYLPTPDFLATTSYYCDDTSKSFYLLSKMYKKDYFLLDVPYDYKDEESVSYLAHQFEEMVKFIEERVNKKLDPQRLREAICLANEARKYFIKINELRRSIPAPMSGGEAIDYAVMLAFTWGSKEMVEICKMLYEELKEKVESDKLKVVPKKKIRLLWRHLRPYYNDTLIDFIESQCDVDVAFEEINYIHWDEMDPSQPYRSLARKVLANPPVGQFEHWLEATNNFINWYNIDGVISFNHWGCRHLCSGAGILRDFLEKKKVPFLEIGGDCIDSRDYSFSQLKTRVEAFLEMIGGWHK